MRKFLAAITVVAGVAVPALAAAGSASAATTSAAVGTPNWSGYYASTSALPVESVTAEFRVPKVSCSQGWGLYPRAVSLWAGFGGMGERLEQAGVEISCAYPWSKPEYVPFWEVVPDDRRGQPLDFTIRPGDVMDVSVNDVAFITVNRVSKMVADPGKWNFNVFDLSTGWRAGHYTLPAGEKPGVATAEVITEWPQVPSYLYTKYSKLYGGLLEAGTVSYTEADVYLVSHTAADIYEPVTEHALILTHNGTTVLGPSAVGAKVPDSFTTQYTGKF